MIRIAEDHPLKRRIEPDMEVAAGSSAKAKRILDATRDLLLSRGARGVTISEVAQRAHVGKGTVYLYWQTKEELIIELFVRDFVAAMDETIATIKASPEMIVPHELFSLLQRTLRKHPFMTALRTRDHEFLGLVEGNAAIEELINAAGPSAFLSETLPVFRDHGMVRTDLSLDQQICATAAIQEGFFNLSMGFPLSAFRHVTSESDALLGDVLRMVIGSNKPVEQDTINLASAAIIARVQKVRDRAAATIGSFDAHNTRGAA